MARIPLIDGLRGIAILGVIYHHTLSWRVSATNGSFIDTLSASGWHGVNLFFLLSGFVLYLPYATGERGLNSWSTIKLFYIRRAQRLLPLYYFSTIFLIIFNLQWDIGNPSDYIKIFHYIFVTSGFSYDTFYPEANWVLWSLGVEIWFSVLFPAVLLLIRRTGWPSALMCMILVSTTVRIVGECIAPGIRQPLNFISDSVIGRLDEFAIGMFAAHIYVRSPEYKFGNKTLLLGASMILGSCALWTNWLNGLFPAWVAGLFNIPLDIGMMLCTMALLAKCRIFAASLSIWPLQMIGMMCFSIYIWHGVVFLKLRPHIDGLVTYTVYLFITLLVSWFTYRYIEFRSTSNWRNLIPGDSVQPIAKTNPRALKS